jgi:tRNA pseudouridine38-40 synthase
MNYYRAIVAYDGTDFYGWQQQPLGTSTIMQALRSGFEKAFHQPLQLVGASRTDAGVHAAYQVMRIKTPLMLDPAVIQRVWQQHLPNTILLRFLECTTQAFHPHYGVSYKRYVYHISLQRPLPFYARYCYYYPFAINLELLEKALRLFEGTHDFRSFCTGYERVNTVRTITAIALEQSPDFPCFRIRIEGPGFLQYQIRRMVGAALAVARGTAIYTLSDIERALAVPNPEQKLPKAPSGGLMLDYIAYTQETHLPVYKGLL